MNKKIYAVCISDDDYVKYAAQTGNYWEHEEAIFCASSITEVKKYANQYRKSWNILDEKIQYIREITQEELDARRAGKYNSKDFISKLVYTA